MGGWVNSGESLGGFGLKEENSLFCVSQRACVGLGGAVSFSVCTAQAQGGEQRLEAFNCVCACVYACEFADFI